ncbi:MAG: CoA-binding protein [Syntrophaceae bacterium]|nr:CoA-binding protein [Syntrophaceae bacterium]
MFERKKEENAKNLTLLFNPRSIAIVGASDDLTRIGGLPIKFLRQHKYPGKIFPVNPKYREIAALRCYPTLKDIPEPLDLALIGIPRALVFQALRDCAEKKVPFVILFSAGYAEMGEGGRKEQEELRRFVRSVGIRMVGPNCIGIVNTHDRVATSFTSGLEIDSLLPGAIGLITQSGGVGNCILTRTYDRSIGLSYFISSGNELDLEISDFLEFLLEDEKTKSIALLLEDLKDPHKFSQVAARAWQAGKPIVALKVGRSEKGRQAAASHTGAMSGSDSLYEALFRQRGISRVFDVDELFEVAHLFASYAPPAGNRLAILTTSGGSGALLADLASDHHLSMPVPSPRTLEQLHDVVPAVAPIANPMDITTQFMNDPEVIARYITTFAEDENFDILLMNFTVSTSDRTLKVADKIAAIHPTLPKPLIFCWPVGNMARTGFAGLEKAGIPLFFHPARCLSALGHFIRYGVHRNKPRR